MIGEVKGVLGGCCAINTAIAMQHETVLWVFVILYFEFLNPSKNSRRWVKSCANNLRYYHDTQCSFFRATLLCEKSSLQVMSVNTTSTSYSFWYLRDCQLWSGNQLVCQTLWSRYEKVAFRRFQQMVRGPWRLQSVFSAWRCRSRQECLGCCLSSPKEKRWKLSSGLFLPPQRYHKKQSQVSTGDYRMSTLQM